MTVQRLIASAMDQETRMIFAERTRGRGMQEIADRLKLNKKVMEKRYYAGFHQAMRRDISEIVRSVR